MNRDLDEFFVGTALRIARFSKCRSKKVGAVLVKDGRIVSIGYNGTPSGHTNCSDVFGESFDKKEHREWSKSNEVHAEMNCLGFAAEYGVPRGCTMYITHSPCGDCLKNSIQHKVTRFVYLMESARHPIPDMMLADCVKNGVTVEKYTPKNLFMSPDAAVDLFASGTSGPVLEIAEDAVMYYTNWLSSDHINQAEEMTQRCWHITNDTHQVPSTEGVYKKFINGTYV